MIRLIQSVNDHLIALYMADSADLTNNWFQMKSPPKIIAIWKGVLQFEVTGEWGSKTELNQYHSILVFIVEANTAEIIMPPLITGKLQPRGFQFPGPPSHYTALAQLTN